MGLFWTDNATLRLLLAETFEKLFLTKCECLNLNLRSVTVMWHKSKCDDAVADFLINLTLHLIKHHQTDYLHRSNTCMFNLF